MAVEFTIYTWIKASPGRIYNTWLDSKGHSAMTGGVARINRRIGAEFTAWDGYIRGKNLELEPEKRILQSWRTTDFTEGEPDSLLEITFHAENGGTRVVISHSQLPVHGFQYEQGWIDHYFTPMKTYFENSLV